jgi:hypothetical protein
MSARRWAVTVQRDLPGPLSTLQVIEAKDGELADCIRTLLDERDVLHVGIHRDMSADELRRRLHHLGEDQEGYEVRDLADGVVN